MPNYKLGIGTKENSRIIEFEDKPHLSILRNLDELTSEFNDERELKQYLFNKGLIDETELRKSIWVKYKHVKVKSIPVIYKDMKKYLEYDYLKEKLMSLSNNLDFLEKLARHYSIGNEKYNNQGLNVLDIRLYLSMVRNNGNYDIDDLKKLLENALNSLFKKAIFREIESDTGEVKEDYRGLRDLALFIYNFERDLNKKQVINIQSSIFESDTKDEEITSDDSGKWVLSSEGDPDFPPNSEEEAQYLRYLEELENSEEERHYRR